MRKRIGIFVLAVLVFMALTLTVSGAAAVAPACPIDNMWTGAVNTTWGNAGNWSCNVVPSGSTKVIIPGGLTYYPKVLGTAVSVTDLKVRAGASFDLNGKSLTVSGKLRNKGTLIDRRKIKGTSGGGTSFFDTGGYTGLWLKRDLPAGGWSNPGVVTVEIKACTPVGPTIERCFDIAPTVTSNISIDARFYFASGEIPPGVTCNLLQAYHWNGTTWVPAGDTGSNVCSGSKRYVVANNMMNFSPFVVSEGQPTAVSFIDLNSRMPLSPVLFGAVIFGFLALLTGLVMVSRKRTHH